MHEFWYDYIKPKYGERTNLCYMDTDKLFFFIYNPFFYPRPENCLSFSKKSSQKNCSAIVY